MATADVFLAGKISVCGTQQHSCALEKVITALKDLSQC